MLGSYDTIGVETKVKKKKKLIQFGVFFHTLVYDEEGIFSANIITYIHFIELR